jgi:hypothetical protein
MRRGLARRAGRLAFPAADWNRLGAEMTDTLLDASAGSHRRYARELGGLVRLGVRTRTARAAAAGTRRLVTDGICLAAVWLLALDLSTLLVQRARGLHDPLLAWPSLALLAATLVVALLGADRLAAAGALAWTGSRLPALLDANPGLAGVAPEVLPVVCFVVLALASRRRSLDPRRLAWLAVPAVLVATLGPPPVDQNPLLKLYVGVAVIALVVYALALLPADPRPAIAGAVQLSVTGIAAAASHHDASFALALMIAAAPAALAVAGARSRLSAVRAA